jgi:hypothetical protein
VSVTSVPGSSTVGTPSSTSSTLVKAPVVDGLLEWSVAAGPFPEGLETFELSGNVLAFAHAPATGVELFVADAGGDPVLVYDPGPDWLAQSLGFSGDSLLAVVSSDAGVVARVWQGDDDGGEVVRQYGPPPPPPRIPYMLIDSEGWVYLTEGPEGEACLNRYNPADWSTFEQVVCDTNIFWTQFTAPGWVSYSGAELPGRRCGPVMMVDVATGARSQVGEDCVVQGAANPEMAVWARPPKLRAAGYNYFRVEIMGRIGDGPMVHLGRGGGGSVRICDGVAYWNFQSFRGRKQIRSWDGEEVRVVYRARNRNYSVGVVHCTSDGIAFLEAGDPIGGDQILVSPPVPWHVEPPD